MSSLPGVAQLLGYICLLPQLLSGNTMACHCPGSSGGTEKCATYTEPVQHLNNGVKGHMLRLRIRHNSCHTRSALEWAYWLPVLSDDMDMTH